MGVLILGNLGLQLPLGSPRTKWHLGASLVAMHREYYKGEGGGFPQVWVVVNFVNPCLPMARSCTKCPIYTLTNMLFGLYKSMWVIDLLVNLPSPHPRVLTRLSTPEMLWAKEHAPTPLSVIFAFGLVVESIKELGGASFAIMFFVNSFPNSLDLRQLICHT